MVYTGAEVSGSADLRRRWDGVVGSCSLHIPLTGPCVIEDQGFGNCLYVSCTLKESYCDLIPGFDDELVHFRVVGWPETVQCVQ